MAVLVTLILGSFSIPIILAVLPAIILMVVVFRQDKIEKEPPGLLVRLFLLGGLSTVFAGLLERMLMFLLDRLIQNPYTYLYNFILYFCVVAIVEEGVKYLFLRTTWSHPAFNYRFDAVVYGVAVALGFAAAENLLYLFYLGIGITPLRAITAIPLHCICGVFMGHYYGMAAACERYDLTAKKAQYHILSVLVPVLIHGFYDFAAVIDNILMELVFFAFVIVLDVIAIISVKRYAREDEAL